MKKILKSFALSILILSSWSTVFAESTEVDVTIPEFDVTVNGQIIDTEHSQYPIISYKSVTYFPMTSDYLNGIGLGLNFSTTEGLKINVKDEVGAFKQKFLGVNNALGSSHKAQLAPFMIEVNDKYIDNNEQAYPVLLYKNITYFPMTWGFAVEEFGWTTSWSNETGFGINVDKTKIIDEVTELKDEVYLAKESILNEKIRYIVDERLFTVFAFINFTGYDDENNEDGFHPVRKAIREELSLKDFKISNNSYYDDKNVFGHYYVNAVRDMGELPNFECHGSDFKPEFSDLTKSLKEFYLNANVHELYIKYKPEYELVLNTYKDEVQKPLIKTFDFLKLDYNALPEIYVQVNLQAPYWSGKGLGGSDVILGKGIITGPSYSPNTINIVHEYLHGVINPITEKNSEVMLRTNYNMKYATKTDSYGDWDNIVNESFCRALSRYGVSDEKTARLESERETDNGFIMTSYVLDRFLNEYSNYNGSLEEFVVLLISEFEYE